MTSSPSARQTADDRSRVRAVIEDTLGDPLAIVLGVVTFLAAVPATVFAMQNGLWDALRRGLLERVNDLDVVAVTPFDVIFLQVRIALLVGFVLALEAVALRWWWPRSPLPGSSRLLLALVGAALLPVGAVLGYEFLFPPVFEFVVGDGWVSAIKWVGLACYVSLTTGVAAQLAFAGSVSGLGRRRRE